MLINLFRKLCHDRKGATALVMAVVLVPLMLAGITAVDMARIAAARTVLQASVDSAAIAGGGALNTSGSTNAATTAAEAAYAGSSASLGSQTISLTPSTNGGLVTIYCQTNSVSTCGALSADTSGVCPSSYYYCVVVTAQLQMSNLLLRWLTPTTFLTARGVATTQIPPTTISGKNIPPSPGFGSAGDVSGIYAYAVPMNGSTPDYTKMPTPNSGCSNYGAIGPLALLESSSASGSTCNYLFIALSTSTGTAGTGGSITLQQNQPIAFSFINYTGAHGYHSSNYYQTTSQLYVSTSRYSTGTYSPGGYQAPVYTTSTYTCSNSNEIDSCPTNVQPNTTTTASTGTTGTSSSCTQNPGQWVWVWQNGGYACTTTVVTETTQALTGQCPDSTLYGSLDPLGNINSTTGANSAEVPSIDSLNVFSSAYEVLGYPPTYETNHALVPFVATSLTNSQNVAGQTYYVTAICPNYTTSGTDASNTSISTTINAPISAGYASRTGWSGLNIFSTSFPGQNYSDNSVNTAEDSTDRFSGSSIWMTSDSNDVYPPAIAACTPATNSSDGGVTTTPSSWWNWHGNNASGNCGNESAANRAAYVSTPGQPQFSNCSLVIQPLGANVPTNGNNQALLPDYYLVVKNKSGTIVGLDPVWDLKTSSKNKSAYAPSVNSFTDQMPGVITNHLGGYDKNITVSGTTVTDLDTPATYNTSGQITAYGYTPTTTRSYTVPAATPIYGGDTVTIEQPVQSGAGNYDFDLPPETSHTCYNPQLNGNPAHTVLIQNGTTDSNGNPTPTQFVAAGDQNDSSTAGANTDPVGNPQLGAILCNSSQPQSYALYWNDLGTYEADDVGYWNAIIAFTCSVPGTSTTGGGPVTLSG